MKIQTILDGLCDSQIRCWGDISPLALWRAYPGLSAPEVIELHPLILAKVQAASDAWDESCDACESYYSPPERDYYCGDSPDY